MEKQIKALSWRQPYASLMLPPANKIETRVWDTKYRGLVLICCSQAPYSQNVVEHVSSETPDEWVKQGHLPANWKFLSGYAIAVGELVDCIQAKNATLDQLQKTFVTTRDPYMWLHIYENVRPIKPFPFKGAQRWTKLDDTIWDKIEFVEPDKH